MKNLQRDQQRDESFVLRVAAIERLRDSENENETKYQVSLSSEAAIRDWPWAPPNVLVHSKDAVDLSGIAERGLPVDGMHARAFGRDIRSVIGRVVNIRLERKRLVGELRFSKANPDAEMVRGMVDEGTLTDMSIEAQPLRVKSIQGPGGEIEKREWIRWRPVRVSIVDAGADQSVGIGRSSNAASAASNQEIEMSDEVQSAVDDQAAGGGDGQESAAVQRIQAGRQQIDGDRAVKLEEQRQKAIRQLAEANSIGEDTVQEWISRGYGLDQVADNILAIHKKRGEGDVARSHIGLTDRETREYSLCRAILAAHSRNWKDAGFELECHEAVAKRINKIPEAGSFFVPLEVQRRLMPTDLQRAALNHGIGYVQRDLNVATPGQGGFLTQTTNMGFDEILRNLSFAFRMGVTRLSGLRDNVAIPRQSAAATAEWLTSETDAPTESQQTFVQLLLSPKTVASYTELSRQLLLQATIDVEGLVNADLAAVAALAVDAAVLNGSGASGQPEGLDNTTGVGAVTGTSLGFAGVLEFQTDVAQANVMPLRGGYVTTPLVAAQMIQRVKYTNTASPLWDGSIWSGTMQGFPALSTNQVAAASMYFGDWAKAVVAEWGVLEVETNPFANFPAGIIGVRAMYSVDVGIRYPAAFSKASTIT